MRIGPLQIVNSAKRSAPEPLSLDDYASYFTYNGILYGLHQTLRGDPQEQIGRDFPSLVRGAYRTSGVVFACILARMLLFSEARFQFRRMVNGRPGDLFGTESLRKLEEPWAGATTGDLLARMEQDASLAGNFFGLDRGPRGIRRLRPDWVTIVLTSPRKVERDLVAWDPDAEVLGYAYTPGGPASGEEPQVFTAEEVCHYAPIPDPEANFRGMSWLQPIVLEVMADKAATSHKLKFFEGGGTPNMVVSFDPAFVRDEAAFERWVAAIRAQMATFGGIERTLFLGGGTQANVVGANLEQIEFKATQGAGETRICMAAGVPPIIVGASEGLESATYSNYGQARRRFADGTMRPLWRNAAGSLARIIDVPPGAELWYDDRDIPFLQEDRKDAAEIRGKEAETIRRLIDGGFLAASVIDAVLNEDWSRLEHSGYFSVQLQELGANGSGPDSRALLSSLLER